jgi:hypothetical protein
MYVYCRMLLSFMCKLRLSSLESGGFCKSWSMPPREISATHARLRARAKERQEDQEGHDRLQQGPASSVCAAGGTSASSSQCEAVTSYMYGCSKHICSGTRRILSCCVMSCRICLKVFLSSSLLSCRVLSMCAIFVIYQTKPVPVDPEILRSIYELMPNHAEGPLTRDPALAPELLERYDPRIPNGLTVTCPIVPLGCSFVFLSLMPTAGCLHRVSLVFAFSYLWCALSCGWRCASQTSTSFCSRCKRARRTARLHFCLQCAFGLRLRQDGPIEGVPKRRKVLHMGSLERKIK